MCLIGPETRFAFQVHRDLHCLQSMAPRDSSTSILAKALERASKQPYLTPLEPPPPHDWQRRRNVVQCPDLKSCLTLQEAPQFWMLLDSATQLDDMSTAQIEAGSSIASSIELLLWTQSFQLLNPWRLNCLANLSLVSRNFGMFSERKSGNVVIFSQVTSSHHPRFISFAEIT